jgi:tripartite tricarboxylate transporter family receptor
MRAPQRRRLSGRFSSARSSEKVLAVISRSGTIHLVDDEGYTTGTMPAPNCKARHDPCTADLAGSSMDRREILLWVGLSLASIMLARAAGADARYPDRPIRLIVPRTGGGVVDVIAREWSEKVRTTLGASYVENIGGGGGTIGAMTAARARPDGYTLLFGTTSELVLNPVLATQSYDPVKDFAPIMIMSMSTEIIAVHPSIPV